MYYYIYMVLANHGICVCNIFLFWPTLLIRSAENGPLIIEQVPLIIEKGTLIIERGPLIIEKGPLII